VERGRGRRHIRRPGSRRSWGGAYHLAGRLCAGRVRFHRLRLHWPASGERSALLELQGLYWEGGAARACATLSAFGRLVWVGGGGGGGGGEQRHEERLPAPWAARSFADDPLCTPHIWPRRLEHTQPGRHYSGARGWRHKRGGRNNWAQSASHARRSTQHATQSPTDRRRRS
jgi:hypothetical protein